MLIHFIIRKQPEIISLVWDSGYTETVVIPNPKYSLTNYHFIQFQEMSRLSLKRVAADAGTPAPAWLVSGSQVHTRMGSPISHNFFTSGVFSVYFFQKNAIALWSEIHAHWSEMLRLVW